MKLRATFAIVLAAQLVLVSGCAWAPTRDREPELTPDEARRVTKQPFLATDEYFRKRARAQDKARDGVEPEQGETEEAGEQERSEPVRSEVTTAQSESGAGAQMTHDARIAQLESAAEEYQRTIANLQATLREQAQRIERLEEIVGVPGK